MQFGLYLVRNGVLRADDFVAALQRQLSERPSLGTLAIEERKLSMKQLFAVLDAQSEDPKPFGRLAVELGFLSPTDVSQLLGLQIQRCRPMAEHLVESGLLDSAAVQRELQRFHADSHSRTTNETVVADAASD